MFQLNEHTKDILGRPNFACAQIAKILRDSGEDINHRSEDEQAHTIYYLLKMYEKHKENWLSETNKELKKMHDQNMANELIKQSVKKQAVD